jgi:pimeloyl-ACP methyl ester carboxylesterase
MRSMLAEVNGVKLAFSDSGSGDAVVLLVHGFPLNRSMWEPQLGALRSVCRVIAPDVRGFGASAAGPPGPLTMEQHADDLAALLDVLDVREPVIYCGLSMGGYIGFAMWRRHRQRIRAFVLADTRATPDTPEGRAGRFAMAERAESLGSSAPAVEAMMPRMFSPTLRPGTPPEVLVRAMMTSTSARAVADGALGMAARPDSLELLTTIDVPTLVIVGEHDQLTPPTDSEAMLARLPNARLERIDMAGHMSNLENPDQFNDVLLEFVRRLAPPGHVPSAEPQHPPRAPAGPPGRPPRP